MRPRKKVFARGYIEEAVNAYRDLKPDTGFDKQEMKWAEDVLIRFFLVVDDAPEIIRAKEIFETVQKELQDTNDLYLPYKRDLSPLEITPQDFYRLSYRRRSVRWFLQKPVPRDVIDKCLEAAVQAPSACNRQPFEFRIYDDPDLVQKVMALPMGGRGFAENTQTVVVVVGHLSAYFHERDRHVIYIDASLASMGFLLALETAGVSSCILNWPDQEPHEKNIQKLLHLTPDERVIMFIAMGYPDPDGEVPFSYKKNLDNIRSYNKM